MFSIQFNVYQKTLFLFFMALVGLLFSQSSKAEPTGASYHMLINVSGINGDDPLSSEPKKYRFHAEDSGILSSFLLVDGSDSLSLSTKGSAEDTVIYKDSAGSSTYLIEGVDRSEEIDIVTLHSSKADEYIDVNSVAKIGVVNSASGDGFYAYMRSGARYDLGEVFGFSDYSRLDNGSEDRSLNVYDLNWQRVNIKKQDSGAVHLKTKRWPRNEVEPSGWVYEYEIANTSNEEGWIPAIMNSRYSTVYRYIGVGINGAEAPIN